MDQYLVQLSAKGFHKKKPSFSFVNKAVIVAGDVLIKFYDYTGFKKQFLFQTYFRTFQLSPSA
jgi:hypothetical protein